MKLVNLLGSGAQADVYEHEGRAVKLFRDGCDKRDVFYEAYANSLIEPTKLPAPEVFETLCIDGKWAIVMELVRGKRVNDLIQSDPKSLDYYIQQMVDLQIETQAQEVSGLRNLKKRLEEKIMSVDILDDEVKDKLRFKLQGLPDGEQLCHNDFHSLNIVMYEGSLYIVDWADAASGSPEADVCRSYLVYSLYASYMADQYLDVYCRKSGVNRKNVLRWLPIIAAARLTERESHFDEPRRLMPWIDEVR